MKNTFEFLGLGASIAVFSLFSACSSGSGTAANVGGTGNADETGGSSGTSVGGGGNAGGSTSTVGGSNGSTGGSAAIPATVINPFDTQPMQAKFIPNTFVPADCSVNAVVPRDGGGIFAEEWSSAFDVNADAAAKGSMKVTATFTNWNQKWAVEMLAPSDALGNPVNLVHKILMVQIMLTAGVSPNPGYPYGAQLYVKTGAGFVWGASPWTNIMALNSWTTLSLDMDNPSGVPAGSVFDPVHPNQIGIQLSTGGAGESAYCQMNYAVQFGSALQTIAYIDQLQYTDRP